MPGLCAEKVREELNEVLEALTISISGHENEPWRSDDSVVEEFGDLMEAMDELRRQLGISPRLIEFAQERKRGQLGSFEGRWVLSRRELPPLHEECWDCDNWGRHKRYGEHGEPMEDFYPRCRVCEEDAWPCRYAGQRTDSRDG
jgi:hypothetical protein